MAFPFFGGYKEQITWHFCTLLDDDSQLVGGILNLMFRGAIKLEY